MQAFCGDAEVTPIHPFKLERRISESETIYEGLYAFAGRRARTGSAGASSSCCTRRRSSAKGDTRVVDLKVLEQVWQDFAPYRALR